MEAAAPAAARPGVAPIVLGHPVNVPGANGKPTQLTEARLSIDSENKITLTGKVLGDAPGTTKDVTFGVQRGTNIKMDHFNNPAAAAEAAAAKNGGGKDVLPQTAEELLRAVAEGFAATGEVNPSAA